MRHLSLLTTFAAALLAAGCTTTDRETQHVPGTKPQAAVCKEEPGVACVWAGQTGALGFNGDGKTRLETMLYWPMDLAFAPDGTPYILDWNNHKLRIVQSDDTVKTVVGAFLGDGAAPPTDPAGENMDPGIDGTLINLNHPTDIVFRDDKVIFAAWHNHKIRQYDPKTGKVRIIYGKGPGFAGDGAPLVDLRFNQPSRLALDSTGALLVIDQRNERVRKISKDNMTIATFAGNGMPGFSGDMGPATMAQLSFETGSNPEPSGAIAVDGDDNVYVATTFANPAMPEMTTQRIRKIDKTGMITTIAGDGMPGYKGDGGKATEAQFNNIKDLEMGPDGRLYVCDTDNNRIRAIDLKTGTVESVAGTGKQGSAAVDGVKAKEIELYRPLGIAFDGKGALYIADTFNSRIVKIPR
jgi:hypothetical protein